MKKLILFPVVVLLIATMVSIPNMWESPGEGYNVSRNISSTVLNNVTERVQYWQGLYGMDVDPLMGSDYLEWFVNWEESYYGEIYDDLYEYLNTQFSTGLTDQIRNLHEKMATELTVKVSELRDPTGDGRYITSEEVYDLIDTSSYFVKALTYEQNLTFSREVSNDQSFEMYSVFAAYYAEYGNPSGADLIAWQLTNATKVKVAMYNKLNQLFDPSTPDVEPEWRINFPGLITLRKSVDYSNKQHESMANELTRLIKDSEALPERAEVTAIIRLDGDIWEQLEIMEGKGFALDPNYIWIGILVGIITMALLVGVKVFDSGLSDSTVSMVVMVSSYYLVWMLLSIGSSGLIRGVPMIGLPIWVGLTFMYTLGVMGGLNGGNE